MVFLYNISLHDNMKDTWNWDLNPYGMYVVKEAYKLMSNFEGLADFPLYIHYSHLK